MFFVALTSRGRANERTTQGIWTEPTRQLSKRLHSSINQLVEAKKKTTQRLASTSCSLKPLPQQTPGGGSSLLLKHRQVLFFKSLRVLFWCKRAHVSAPPLSLPHLQPLPHSLNGRLEAFGRALWGQMGRQSGVLLCKELLLRFFPQSDLLPVVCLLHHKQSPWLR